MKIAIASSLIIIVVCMILVSIGIPSLFGMIALVNIGMVFAFVLAGLLICRYGLS